MALEPTRTYAHIYNVVRQIPSGQVATYGQVAHAAGLPGQARQVGYALHALLEADTPWHRVINAKGTISPRAEPEQEQRQRELLEREGVVFDAQGRVDLKTYRWDVPLPDVC